MNIGAQIHAWTATSSGLRHRTIEAGNRHGHTHRNRVPTPTIYWWTHKKNRASAEVRRHIRPKHKLYAQHTPATIHNKKEDISNGMKKKTTKKQCVSATGPVPFASSNANQFERNEWILAYMAAKYTRLLRGGFFFFNFCDEVAHSCKLRAAFFFLFSNSWSRSTWGGSQHYVALNGDCPTWAFLPKCCYKWWPRKCLGRHVAKFNSFLFPKNREEKSFLNHKNFISCFLFFIFWKEIRQIAKFRHQKKHWWWQSLNLMVSKIWK